MRVAPSSKVPFLIAVLATAFYSGSCQREHPATPDVPAAASAVGEGTAHATGQTDGNQPPTAVFKTTPPANDESVIMGGRSLTVTFNLCQSSDPDPGDELRFWFDYDNDGTQDEYGHCRATHTYTVGEFDSACVFTKACVSDRQPQHAICHTYQVCTFGKPRPAASPSVEPGPGPSPSGSPGPSPSPSTSPGPSPSPSTSPGPSPSPSTSPDPGLTSQKADGDFVGSGSNDVWSFTAAAGTAVTIQLDTVSDDSAYFMGVCISSNGHRPCMTPKSQTRVRCSAGKGIFSLCPKRSYVLPENGGLYHVIVSGFRLGGQGGEYVILMTAHPGTGPLGLEADNIGYEEIQ